MGIDFKSFVCTKCPRKWIQKTKTGIVVFSAMSILFYFVLPKIRFYQQTVLSSASKIIGWPWTNEKLKTTDLTKEGSSVIKTTGWTNEIQTTTDMTKEKQKTTDLTNEKEKTTELTKEKQKTTNLTKERWVKSVECIRLFNNEKSEIIKALSHGDNKLTIITPNEYLQRTKNCTAFLRDRKYIINNISDEEINFPIAFSIMIHKDVHQVERLLRAIYRPQNFYCIHADTKMSDVDKNTLNVIISCLKNVFLSTTSYNVTWGKVTILEADIACMRDLLRLKWKYFINLTGQEFPLKTNLEIVRILQAYNGANDVQISNRMWNERWRNAKGAPPGRLTPYKGRVHITVSRPFVEFVIKDRKAIDLLAWLEPTLIPDETFFTTLNFNPHLQIPGSFNGKVDRRKILGFGSSLNRFKRWSFNKDDYTCHGKFVRWICIPGTADLPVLNKRPELFLNKLYWNYHHYVLDCMEELIYNRTIDGLHGNLKLNMSIYENMYFVKHSVK